MELRTATARRRQQGFVLVIALVIMVVMTLSAVAMITSLRGGLSASGNISFRQAATRAADVAADGGYTWIQGQIAAAATALDSDVAPINTAGALVTPRYYATMAGSDAGCKKDGVANAFAPQNYRFSDTATGNDGFPCAGRITGSPAGYSVFYVIHRLARTAGMTCPAAECVSPQVNVVAAPPAAGCSLDPTSASFCGVNPASMSAAVYYRITVKVVGPRQNNRYVQAFVY
jgi:type IV pilus assembly protein PilX